ncbi:MAG: hypothetical protein U0133_11405 [Gemmatimonadales bacterium]
MSRLTRWSLLFLPPLLVTSLAAQDKAEIDRLSRKADSLAQLWKEADALADLADSLASAPVIPPTDTLRVGGLLIITNRTPLPVRAAAERAWPVIDSLYGSAASRLATTPYYVQATDPDSTRLSPRWWGTQIPWDRTVKETADLLALYVPMPPTDQAYQHWAGNNLRPSTRGWLVDMGESYVALVTSHYQIGQQCFLGRLDRCRTLLELDSVFDPLRVYPTLEERQKIARLLYVAYDQAGLRAEVVPCLSGVDAACKAAVTKLPKEQLPKPASPLLRAALAQLAVKIGGRDGYSRLMADSLAPMSVRLSGAAGIPLDSLLSRWHDEVIAARPRPVAIPPFGVAVGLGWGLVLGLVAVRSSRWRAL